MTMSNCRYDWYQTERNVVIDIMIKKLAKENVEVDFNDDSVSFYAKLMDTNNTTYSMEFDLENDIVVSRDASVYRSSVKSIGDFLHPLIS